MEPRLWLERSYELGSIRPSVRLSVLLSGSFLGIGSLVFSHTQHGARGPYDVVFDRAEFFEKKYFSSKYGKSMTKIGQKCVFLNLLQNLFIIFFRIRSIIKVYVIAYTILFVVRLLKSHIWEKPDSGDMGQNAVSQSDCRIFKSTISLEQNYEIA